MEKSGLGNEKKVVRRKLRWVFIRKVYGIIAVQLGLNIISATISTYAPLLAPHAPVLATSLLFPWFCLVGYEEKPPWNFILLGILTLINSSQAAFVCKFYGKLAGKLVLEGLILTTVATLSLTIYTFWAAKKSKKLRFLQPLAFTALMTVSSTLLIQELFHPICSPILLALFGMVAPVLYSYYLLYTTKSLINDHTFDIEDYIAATIKLNYYLMTPANLIFSVLNIKTAISIFLSLINS